jgi:hypothetical protein
MAGFGNNIGPIPYFLLSFHNHLASGFKSVQLYFKHAFSFNGKSISYSVATVLII